MASLATTLFIAAALLSIVTGTEFYATLNVVQDVTLEGQTKNFNYLEFLIVGTHPYYPLKRSLVQFQNLPSNCHRVIQANLYLWFVYAHQASGITVDTFRRTIVAHRVLKSWSEKYATSSKRLSYATWDRNWLNFSSDVVVTPTSSGVSVDPNGGAKWYKLDVTRAAEAWTYGQPNYGFLIRATNEFREGRDFRFYSKQSKHKGAHPYMIVRCNSDPLLKNGGLQPVGKGNVGRGGGVPAI